MTAETQRGRSFCCKRPSYIVPESELSHSPECDLLPPTDQGHLRKYLATLGVAIVVASIAVGGFILQMQSDLLVEQKKINEASETGRLALDKKQHIILFLFQWAPLALGALAAFGIGLAIYGLKGWAKKQKTIDQKEETEAEKVKVELESLQASEGRKALERERDVEAALKEIARDGSEEALGDLECESVGGPQGSDEGDAEAGRHSDGSVPTGDAPSATASAAKGAVSRAEARNEIVALENAFIQKLSSLFGKDNVVNGAQILPAAQQDSEELGIYIDAVAVDPVSRQGFALELKSLRSTTPFRYYNALITCALAAKRLREMKMFSAQSFKPVLVIIIEDDEIGMSRIGLFRYQLEQVADLFAEAPKILIYAREQFMSLKNHELLYGLA